MAPPALKVGGNRRFELYCSSAESGDLWCKEGFSTARICKHNVLLDHATLPYRTPIYYTSAPCAILYRLHGQLHRVVKGTCKEFQGRLESLSGVA